MFATDDGIFHPDSNAIRRHDGFPSLTGRLEIQLRPREVAFATKALAGKATSGQDLRLVLLGRSGHAQVGLEVMVDGAQGFTLSAATLSVPVRIMALGSIREPWLESLLDLTRNGHPVRIGRVLGLDYGRRLSRARLARAFDERYLACDASYEINDDGSVSMQIEDTEFFHHQRAFTNPDVRRSVLLHSRSALLQHQDIRPHAEKVLAGNALTILGIRFSSGPCPALIRPQITKDLMHLRGGLYLDAFRSTRIGRAYGASGLRQIELFNAAAHRSRRAPSSG